MYAGISALCEKSFFAFWQFSVVTMHVFFSHTMRGVTVNVFFFFFFACHGLAWLRMFFLSQPFAKKDFSHFPIFFANSPSSACFLFRRPFAKKDFSHFPFFSRARRALHVFFSSGNTAKCLQKCASDFFLAPQARSRTIEGSE